MLIKCMEIKAPTLQERIAQLEKEHTETTSRLDERLTEFKKAVALLEHDVSTLYNKVGVARETEQTVQTK